MLCGDQERRQPLDVGQQCERHYKNSSGYYGWRYEIQPGEVWGSFYDNGDIAYTTYSDTMTVWYNRGTSATLTSSTLNINTTNASIYDYAGNLAATVRNGVVISNRNDIFVVSDPVDSGNGGENSGGVNLWISQEYFTVVNEDAGLDQLSMKVSGENSSVSVSTSSDRVFVYANENDETNVVLVNGKDESYKMVFSSGEDGEVRLTGTTKEGIPACFAQISGELSGMGIGENSQLSIDGALGYPGQRTEFAGYDDAAVWAEGSGLLQNTNMETNCLRCDAVAVLYRALG